MDCQQLVKGKSCISNDFFQALFNTFYHPFKESPHHGALALSKHHSIPLFSSSALSLGCVKSVYLFPFLSPLNVFALSKMIKVGVPL